MEIIKKWLYRIFVAFLVLVFITLLTLSSVIANFMVTNIKLWYLEGKDVNEYESNSR